MCVQICQTFVAARGAALLSLLTVAAAFHSPTSNFDQELHKAQGKVGGAAVLTAIDVTAAHEANSSQRTTARAPEGMTLAGDERVGAAVKPKGVGNYEVDDKDDWYEGGDGDDDYRNAEEEKTISDTAFGASHMLSSGLKDSRGKTGLVLEQVSIDPPLLLHDEANAAIKASHELHQAQRESASKAGGNQDKPKPEAGGNQDKPKPEVGIVYVRNTSTQPTAAANVPKSKATQSEAVTSSRKTKASSATDKAKFVYTAKKDGKAATSGPKAKVDAAKAVYKGQPAASQDADEKDYGDNTPDKVQQGGQSLHHAAEIASKAGEHALAQASIATKAGNAAHSEAIAAIKAGGTAKKNGVAAAKAAIKAITPLTRDLPKAAKVAAAVNQAAKVASEATVTAAKEETAVQKEIQKQRSTMKEAAQVASQVQSELKDANKAMKVAETRGKHVSEVVAMTQAATSEASKVAAVAHKEALSALKAAQGVRSEAAEASEVADSVHHETKAASKAALLLDNETRRAKEIQLSLHQEAVNAAKVVRDLERQLLAATKAMGEVAEMAKTSPQERAVASTPNSLARALTSDGYGDHRAFKGIPNMPVKTKRKVKAKIVGVISLPKQPPAGSAFHRGGYQGMGAMSTGNALSPREMDGFNGMVGDGTSGDSNAPTSEAWPLQQDKAVAPRAARSDGWLDQTGGRSVDPDGFYQPPVNMKLGAAFSEASEKNTAEKEKTDVKRRESETTDKTADKKTETKADVKADDEASKRARREKRREQRRWLQRHAEVDEYASKKGARRQAMSKWHRPKTGATDAGTAGDAPVRRGAQSAPDMASTPSMDGMEDMKTFQDSQGMPDNRGMQGMSETQNLEGMQGMQDMGEMQNMQGMSDFQRMQEIKRMERLQGMSGMQPNPAMNGMQNFQGMPPDIPGNEEQQGERGSAFDQNDQGGFNDIPEMGFDGAPYQTLAAEQEMMTAPFDLDRPRESLGLPARPDMS